MGGLKQSLLSVGEQMLLVLVLYPRVSSCHASLHPAKGRRGQLVGPDDRQKGGLNVQHFVPGNYISILNSCVRHDNIIAL